MDSLLAAFQGLFASLPPSPRSRAAATNTAATAATSNRIAPHGVVDPEVLRAVRRLDINKCNQLWHVHCALAPNKATMEYIVDFMRRNPDVVSQLVIVSFYMLQHDGSLTVLKDFLAETTSTSTRTQQRALVTFHIQSNGINPMCAGHLLSALYHDKSSITKLVLSHVGFHGTAAGGACLQQLLEKSINLQQLELAFIHLGLPGIRGLAAGLLANNKKDHGSSSYSSSSTSSLTHLCIRNCILGGGDDDDDEEQQQSLDAIVDAIVIVTTPRRRNGSRGLESLHLAENDITTAVSSTTTSNNISTSNNHFVSAIIRLLEQSRLKTLALGDKECSLLFQHHNHQHHPPTVANHVQQVLARTLTHKNAWLEILDLSACHDLPDAACAMLIHTLESNDTLQALILGSSSSSSLPANDENNRDNINNNNNNNLVLVHHHHHRYPRSSSQLLTSLPKIKGLRRLHLPWNVLSSSPTNNNNSNTAVATTTTTTAQQQHQINIMTTTTTLAALYRNTSLEHLYHGDQDIVSTKDNNNAPMVTHIMKRNRQLNLLKSLFVQQQQPQGGGGSSSSSSSSSMGSNSSSSATTVIPPGLWLAALNKLARWQNATAVYKVIRQATFHDGSLVVLHSNYYQPAAVQVVVVATTDYAGVVSAAAGHDRKHQTGL